MVKCSKSGIMALILIAKTSPLLPIKHPAMSDTGITTTRQLKEVAARVNVRLHDAMYVSGRISVLDLFKRATDDLKGSLLHLYSWLRCNVFFQVLDTFDNFLVVRELSHEHSKIFLLVGYQDLMDLQLASHNGLDIHVYAPGSPEINVHFQHGLPGDVSDVQARIEHARNEGIFVPFQHRMRALWMYADACEETHGSFANCTQSCEQRDPTRALLIAKLQLEHAIMNYVGKAHCVPGNTAAAAEFNWQDQHTQPETLQSILSATEKKMGFVLQEEFKWAFEKNASMPPSCKDGDSVLERVGFDAKTAIAHGPMFLRDGVSLPDRVQMISRQELVAAGNGDKRACESADEHAGGKRAKHTACLEGQA